MTMGDDGCKQVLVPEGDAVATLGVMACRLARPLTMEWAYAVGEGQRAYDSVEGPGGCVKTKAFGTTADGRRAGVPVFCGGG